MAGGTIEANGSTDWENFSKGRYEKVVLLLSFGEGTVTLQASPDDGATVFDVEAYTADAVKSIDIDGLVLKYRLTTTDYSSAITWFMG